MGINEVMAYAFGSILFDTFMNIYKFVYHSIEFSAILIDLKITLFLLELQRYMIFISFYIQIFNLTFSSSAFLFFRELQRMNLILYSFLAYFIKDTCSLSAFAV